MAKVVLDKNSKDMIEDISTLLGVKSDIVKSVWEFTLISWLLKYSKSENKVKSITVPYLGTIGIRYNGDTISNNSSKLSGDYDVFVSLSDEFKNLLYSVDINDSKEISNLIQSEIKKIAEQVD